MIFPHPVFAWFNYGADTDRLPPAGACWYLYLTSTFQQCSKWPWKSRLAACLSVSICLEHCRRSCLEHQLLSAPVTWLRGAGAARLCWLELVSVCSPSFVSSSLLSHSRLLAPCLCPLWLRADLWMGGAAASAVIGVQSGNNGGAGVLKRSSSTCSNIWHVMKFH